MPTYGYRCKSCSYEMEEFQKITDPPLMNCPSCHKDTLVRIIGAGAGLVFKGSGFYLTDYKKKSVGGGESSASSGGKKKTESKPESKSDSGSSSKPAGGSSSPSSGGKG